MDALLYQYMLSLPLMLLSTFHRMVMNLCVPHIFTQCEKSFLICVYLCLHSFVVCNFLNIAH